MSPKVSVLLPAYNAQEIVREAVDSILAQTFSDFELIIIEDGSSDDTFAVLQTYTDPRIKLIRHEQNMGLVTTLNQGIESASGEYIARMDADDISLPHRLQVQVDFLDANPDIAIVGGWSEIFGAKQSIRQVPETHDFIKAWMLFSSMLIHPVVTMRSSVIKGEGFKYDPEFRVAQDFELWSRLLQNHKAHNLQEVLIKYRAHDNKIGARHSDNQAINSNKVRDRLLRRLGLSPTQEEMQMHIDLSYWKFAHPIHQVDQWLDKISSANRQKQIYSETALHEILMDRWARVLRSNRLGFGQKANFLFNEAKLPSGLEKFKLLLGIKL